MNFMTINPGFYPPEQIKNIRKTWHEKIGDSSYGENSQLQNPDSTKIERIKFSAGNQEYS